MTGDPPLVDLHCHILPGLDDGALDMEDSVGMAAQADEDGVGTICATPHIRHDHDVLTHELAGRVAAVNEELGRRGLAARVTVGGEVAETSLASLDDAELRAVSLGGTGRWILLEPRPGPLSESLAAAIDELASRSCRAVVAHPERHLGEHPERILAELVGRGALVQATAAALEQADTAPTLMRLAGLGLVHVLGSDSHSSRAGRPVRLARALEELRGVPLVRGHLDWIAYGAPEAIVRGEDVEPPFRPAAG